MSSLLFLVLILRVDASPPLEPATMTPRHVFLKALERLELVPRPADRFPALEDFIQDAHGRILADSPTPQESARRRRVLLIGLGVLFDRADLLEQTPLAGDLFRGIVRPDEKKRRSRTVDGVFLGGRADASKHYFLSAALTAGLGPFLADRVGRNKEIRDARRLQDRKEGSGFSFLDLAHNHAGIRYATWILGQNGPERLSALPPRPHRFAPDFGELGLPEGLDWDAFKSGYQGPNRAEYQRNVKRIHERIDASLAGE